MNVKLCICCVCFCSCLLFWNRIVDTTLKILSIFWRTFFFRFKSFYRRLLQFFFLFNFGGNFRVVFYHGLFSCYHNSWQGIWTICEAWDLKLCRLIGGSLPQRAQTLFKSIVQNKASALGFIISLAWDRPKKIVPWVP